MLQFLEERKRFQTRVLTVPHKKWTVGLCCNFLKSGSDFKLNGADVFLGHELRCEDSARSPLVGAVFLILVVIGHSVRSIVRGSVSTKRGQAQTHCQATCPIGS
ncbi:MAG: hypothetical protein V3V08_18000 [Nannocystaceae bacterium]